MTRRLIEEVVGQEWKKGKDNDTAQMGSWCRSYQVDVYNVSRELGVGEMEQLESLAGVEKSRGRRR